MIHKLHIKNFKLIKDNSFDFKPLTIITGTNSCGKSSILQTLCFFILGKDEAYEIVKLLFKDLQKSLENKGIKASLSENAALLIAKDGFDPDFGARPLRRAIYDLIEDKLSDMILADKLNENDEIVIDAKNDEIVIEKA